MAGHRHLKKSERRRQIREGKKRKREMGSDALNEQTAIVEQMRERRAVKPLEARTQAQGHYMLSINSKQLTFGLGPAGTGKTYVCTALAAQALRAGDTEKLILTRPAVEAGESLGFLPGSIEEKFDPYMTPFREILNEYLGRSTVDYMIKRGKIEAAPLAYMRGRTFRDAWVILDEAQNTTPTQMKMFLTRIGENSKIIVNGDATQQDISGDSGLTDAFHRVGSLRYSGSVEFDMSDVVRSGIVRDILEAYSTR